MELFKVKHFFKRETTKIDYRNNYVYSIYLEKYEGEVSDFLRRDKIYEEMVITIHSKGTLSYWCINTFERFKRGIARSVRNIRRSMYRTDTEATIASLKGIDRIAKEECLCRNSDELIDV